MKENATGLKTRGFIFSNWSIKKKLTSMITFVALMSVLLGGIAVVVEDIFQSEEEFSERLILIAKMVGNYAAVDVQFSDSFAAKQSLAILNDIPSIINAFLFDVHGKVFVSFNEMKYGSNTRLSEIIQKIFENDKLIITMPIEFNGKQNGYIQLIASTKEISEKIQNRLIMTGVLGVILSIFVYVLAYWLQGIISRPILSLAQTAKRLSDSPDYSMRVNYKANDEIGLLYQSFNQMLDTIELEQKHTRDLLRELKKNEAQFSAMFESIPDAVIFVDAKQKIRLINPAVTDLFQYSHTDIIGKTSEILYPSNEAYLKQGNVQYKRGENGVTLPQEVQYKRMDGSIFLAESMGTKVVASNGEHIGYLGIFRDITDRKKAEEKLIRQQEEQKQILDTMVDAVISIDTFGIVTSMNQGAVLMFKYEAHEVIGKNINLLMIDEMLHLRDNFIQNYFDEKLEKNIGRSRETSGLRKTGEVFPIRLSISELPKRLDGTRQFIGSCQDISQEKQQDEIIQRSQKMDALGKLTGGVAHDFNNMIGVILGYSQLLESLLDQKSKAFQFNDEISKAGERAKKLTGKLLSFARKRPIDAQRSNINELLNETQLMLEKTLTARIRLSLVLDKSLWAVNIDKSSFVDSVLNMSINSMHAMTDGGKLKITTENMVLSQTKALLLGLSVGDYVKVSLTDTGLGMTEDIQNRLFEPFYTTKGEHGTGLGLSQVYGFVNQSKGSIQVSSTIGRGTCFDLYFPRDVNSHVQELQHDKIKTVNNALTANILVVDDEISVLNLANEILSNKGYHVLTASSASSALDILQKNPVDVLISDIVMPKMDGYELADIVKKTYPNIQIQLVSGYHDIGSRKISDETLRKNVITKPYLVSELLNRTHELVRNSYKKPHNELHKNLSILVIDDEENIHKLLELNFRKLGCQQVSAYTGEEAINAYKLSLKNNKPFDLVIVDLNIAGSIGGLEISSEILALNSQAKIIVSSGDSQGEVMLNYKDYGFKAAMEKNYNKDIINHIIERVVEG